MYNCLYPYPAYSIFSQTLYPPVNTQIFSKSVKSVVLLMEQGNILLHRLGNASFAAKLMEAAQQGKQKEVDKLIKSIGLKVPITTHFTPSGVIFTLSTITPANCCTLTYSMKWGT